MSDMQFTTSVNVGGQSRTYRKTATATDPVNINAGPIGVLLPGLSGAGLLTDAALAVIFRNVHLYVSRRSDRAYQWIRMVAP